MSTKKKTRSTSLSLSLSLSLLFFSFSFHSLSSLFGRGLEGSSPLSYRSSDDSAFLLCDTLCAAYLASSPGPSLRSLAGQSLLLKKRERSGEWSYSPGTLYQLPMNSARALKSPGLLLYIACPCWAGIINQSIIIGSVNFANNTWQLQKGLCPGSE